MPIEHHYDLTQEFPEYKDKIHDLKTHNPHFNKLYEQYRSIDKEIYRIEQQIETPSDIYTEDLKKQRAQLKDEIYEILRR